jgi:type II secretory pathway component PulC
MKIIFTVVIVYLVFLTAGCNWSTVIQHPDQSRTIKPEVEHEKKPVKPFAEKKPAVKFAILPKPALLGLYLVGIKTKNDQSFAYIEDINLGKTQEYKIGDTVDQAKIITITRDAIVLIKDSRRIVLTLTNPYAWQQEEWINSHGENDYIVSKNRLRKNIVNINAIFQDVGISPHIRDNKFAGIEIIALDSQSRLSLSGFQQGDIVEKINDQSIDSLAGLLEIYSQIRTQLRTERFSQIKIAIERENSPQTLTYRIID